MLRKICLSLLGVLLLLCLMLLVLASAMLHSERLSGWLVHEMVAYVNAETSFDIRYEELSGKLFYGIEFRELEIALAEGDEADSIYVQHLTVAWRLSSLLRRHLHISNMAIEGMSLNFHPAEENEPSAPPDPQAVLDSLFQIPLSISLDDINIGEVDYASGDTILTLQEFTGKLQWNRERLALEDALIHLDPVRMSIPHMRLNRDTTLNAELTWQAAVSDQELAGALLVEGDLQTLQIQHTLQLPLTLETRGMLESGFVADTEPSFDFLHRVPLTTAADIPVEGITDWVENVQAELHTSGAVNAIAVDAGVIVELNEGGVVESEFNGTYADERLDIRRLTVTSGYGNLAASGELLPAPLSLALDWQLDTGQVAGLPESVSLASVMGNGSVGLQQLDEGLAVQIELSRLDADLNGQPLHAEGNANLLDMQVLDVGFDLQSGDNTVRLSGTVMEQIALDWFIEAPALDALLPGLSGQLQGAGQLTGTPEAPQLVGALTGRRLAFDAGDMKVRVEALDFNADADLGGAELSLNANDLSLLQGEREWPADSLVLSATANADDHAIDIGFTAPDLDIDIRLSGAVSDAVWQGNLEQASFDTDYGNWGLQAPAAITASAEQAEVAEVCWQMQPVSLCAGGSWQRAAGADAFLEMAGIPLAYLTRVSVLSETSLPELAGILNNRPVEILQQQVRYNLFLPEHFFARGQLGARLDVTTPDGSFDLLQGELSLLPEAAVIGLVSEDETDGEVITNIREFSIGAQEVSVRRQPGLWSGRVALDIQQDEAGGLQGQLELLQSLDDEGQLQGSALLDFPDLQWLESVLPDIADTRGRLHMQGNINGGLSQPQLQMNLEVSDAGFRLPVAGIEVSALNLAVRSDDDNNFYYEGSALSGEGNLAISGAVLQPFLPERQISLDIAGEGFRVMELPGTVLDVSPSLVVTFQEDVVDINGEVLIPYLDVELEEALSSTGISAVNVSRDVVLVDGTQQRLVLDTTGNSGIPMRMSVGVTLGDYVHLAASGLDIRLGGDVLLEQQAGRPLLVYGEVNVLEGAYEMYGQRLETERGQLLFLGNPANPALDVRAFREVDTTIVGIQLSGTLNSMQGQLYSIPGLPETEVLAMLVTGRSLGSAGQGDTNRMLATIVNLGLERGQGITDSVRSGLGVDTLELSGGNNLEDSYLGIGKYITPRLFMRYDIGLFDRESVLTMIYELTQRINLEVESGISQSIDLTYKLEK